MELPENEDPDSLINKYDLKLKDMLSLIAIQGPEAKKILAADVTQFFPLDVWKMHGCGNDFVVFHIENQISDIKSLELTLKFNQENQSLLFHGKVIPYNLRIGRAMSYHE